MSAPGGRGSALILVVAKVSKSFETKEFLDIKFVNDLTSHSKSLSFWLDSLCSGI
jgi:hypothetical protein